MVLAWLDTQTGCSRDMVGHGITYRRVCSHAHAWAPYCDGWRVRGGVWNTLTHNALLSFDRSLLQGCWIHEPLLLLLVGALCSMSSAISGAVTDIHWESRCFLTLASWWGQRGVLGLRWSHIVVLFPGLPLFLAHPVAFMPAVIRTILHPPQRQSSYCGAQWAPAGLLYSFRVQWAGVTTLR